MSNNEGKKQPLIGVLIGDVSFDFSQELMAGVCDTAAHVGAKVVFLLGMQRHSRQTHTSESVVYAVSHNSVYDYASLVGADAFIIACGSLSGYSGAGLYRQFLERFGDHPYVVLQEKVEDGLANRTCIVIENYQSYYRCIEHLVVDHGYWRIAYVSGPAGHPDARERLRAFRDAMANHQVPVAERDIIYGDFSEYVDVQVERLLTERPNLQAIAFANDEMAKAGYRVCHKLGLTVGRDIAITGFDNLRSALQMEPPLSTVSQDTYRMGVLAIEAVMALYGGKRVPAVIMQTEFIRRQSCGCARENKYPALSPGMDDEKAIDAICDAVISSYISQFGSREQASKAAQFRGCLLIVKDYALREDVSLLETESLTQRLRSRFTQSALPALLLSRCLESQIRRLLCCHDPMTDSLSRFVQGLIDLNQVVQEHTLQTVESRYERYRAQSWIAPDLTHGLLDAQQEETIFQSIVERLLGAGLKRVYLCLLEEPRRYQSHAPMPIPGRLLLCAYADGNTPKAKPMASATVMDAHNPLRNQPGFLDNQALLGFSVYSGAMQYGVLFCEPEKDGNALMYVIGMQLGMLLDFLDLRRKEKAIAQELENIREKNEILNFLSEYDSLCGLLNRRGFIERAIRLNRESIGKKAYCVFLDLDYLKQINDTFGHSEGDAALQGVSAILREVATEQDLIGRIGGDEFIGLFVTDDPFFEEHFRQRFRVACEHYNHTEKRPYLLDVSIGVAGFVCQQGVEISKIISEADQYLYDAKHCREHLSLRKPDERDGSARLSETQRAKP